MRFIVTCELDDVDHVSNKMIKNAMNAIGFKETSVVEIPMNLGIVHANEYEYTVCGKNLGSAEVLSVTGNEPSVNCKECLKEIAE